MRHRWRPLVLATVVLTSACGGGGQPGPAEPKVVGYEPGTMVPPAPTTDLPRVSVPPSTPSSGVTVPSGAVAAPAPVSPVRVAYRVDNRVRDADGLAELVAQILGDDRSWKAAGFTFVQEPTAKFSIVLAEPAEVDRLCVPLRTGGRVSCQNGPVVVINADRWRKAVPDWNKGVPNYRTYVINHEVGHLVGMRHPAPQCPVAKALASVMDQQTKGLAGCAANWWPLDWELE